MTDIDTEVENIRKRKLTFKAGANAAADAKVKTTLTPVGAERKAALPNDTGVFMSNEALALHAKSLRKFAEDALRIADGIDVMLGVVEAGVGDLNETVALERSLMDVERKRLAADERLVQSTGPSATPREKAAATEAAKRIAAAPQGEEKFDQRMARLSAEAQAQVFKGNLVPAAQEIFGDMLVTDAGSASADPEWVCPVHGGQAIRVLTRRSTGKEYRACESCAQFEK